jgi:hypothetical protein
MASSDLPALDGCYSPCTGDVVAAHPWPVSYPSAERASDGGIQPGLPQYGGPQRRPIVGSGGVVTCS